MAKQQQKSLDINDVEYVRKDSIPVSPETTKDVRIVVLQRGWVVVGRFKQDGPNCSLTDAKVIRQWGTVKGLGEIALNGPTSKTVLDPSPVLRFHELTVVMTIDCVGSKWGV